MIDKRTTESKIRIVFNIEISFYIARLTYSIIELYLIIIYILINNYHLSHHLSNFLLQINR